jgi:hypothetical protein
MMMAFKGREMTTDSDRVSRRNGGEVLLVSDKGIHTEFQMRSVSFELPFLSLSRTLILMRRSIL